MAAADPTDVQVLPSVERRIVKPFSLLLLSLQARLMRVFDTVVAARLVGAAGMVSFSPSVVTSMVLENSDSTERKLRAVTR